jgi:hypothetical protein
MEKSHIRKEIYKLLEEVPESILQDVLVFLKEVNSSEKEAMILSNNMRKILIQDKELLKRLAK